MVRAHTEVKGALREAARALLIVEPIDINGEHAADLMAALHANSGLISSAVYYDPKRYRPIELLRLGAAGMQNVILRGADDDPRALRGLLHPDVNRRLLGRLLSAGPVLPDRLQRVLTWCFEERGSVEKAGALARRLGVSRRTLTNWAVRAGFRGMRGFTSRCRAVHAIGYAVETGLPIEAVALELGFNSAAHLSALVRRSTGLPIRAAIRAHDFREWCHTLLRPGPGYSSHGPAFSRGTAAIRVGGDHVTVR